MENLDLKQMSAMVDIIAEEKGLPKEVVLSESNKLLPQLGVKITAIAK